MKKLALSLLAIALAIGAVVALAGLKTGAPGRSTCTVRRETIVRKAIVSGKIAAHQEVHVKSRLSGVVARCYVEAGDEVKAGDPLIEIAPNPTPVELNDAQRDVQSARIRFERISADHERNQELHKEGILPAQELGQSRETYEHAKVALAQAEERRDLLRRGRILSDGDPLESVIRAPVNGTVLARMGNPGDTVVPLTPYQPGTELVTLADMSRLVLKGTVDEIDVGRLQPGLEARISAGALPGVEIRGRLARVAPKAREEGGRTLFDVDIEIVDAAGHVLRAGYSTNAEIIVETRKDVLAVPERVVEFAAGGTEASVERPPAKEGGTPRRVRITTGLSDGMKIEVLSGLEEGDLVLEPAPRPAP